VGYGWSKNGGRSGQRPIAGNLLGCLSGMFLSFVAPFPVGPKAPTYTNRLSESAGGGGVGEFTIGNQCNRTGNEQGGSPRVPPTSRAIFHDPSAKIALGCLVGL